MAKNLKFFFFLVLILLLLSLINKFYIGNEFLEKVFGTLFVLSGLWIVFSKVMSLIQLQKKKK